MEIEKTEQQIEKDLIRLLNNYKYEMTDESEYVGFINNKLITIINGKPYRIEVAETSI